MLQKMHLPTITISILSASFLATPDSTPTQPATSGSDGRVVKQFDFDERKVGNFESIPINWRRITDEGYPRFLEPQFDQTIGHDAAPSLYLRVVAGSSGIFYVGKDIGVLPGCNYLVSSWIKPDRLVHAGARIRAYYLDSTMSVIADSERVGDIVRVDDNGISWRHVIIRLPVAGTNACCIGLSCSVEQSEHLPQDANAPRAIPHRDANAGAWFDDITVLRMPRVSLSGLTTANVFETNRPADIVACIADTDGKGIEGQLRISDATGRLLHQIPVPVVARDHPGETIRLPVLGAGLYHAVLRVNASHGEMAQAEMEFVCLAAHEGPTLPTRGGLRVLLSPEAVQDVNITLQMLDSVGVGAVQIPVWHGAVRDQSVLEGDPNLDRILRSSKRARRSVCASLIAPPGRLSSLVKAPNDSVLDLLAMPPSAWRSYIALLFTRYGSLIDSWQIGDAFKPLSTTHPALAAAIRQLREESGPLIGDARLSTAFSITETPPGRDRVSTDEIMLTVPATTPAHQLPNYLDAFRKAGYSRITLALAPSDAGRYQRLPRLADWATRIILSRIGGAESVLVPQPWHSAVTAGVATISFDETLFITRTLSHELRDLRCVGPVWLGHGIEAWLFGDTQTDEGVIAAWTDGADPIGRTVVCDVGAQSRRIDLWGNVTPIRSTPEGSVLSLDYLPVLIGPMKASRVALMTTFEVDAPGLSVQTGPQSRRVHLTNPGNERLRGLLRLRGPHGWRVVPQNIMIDVQPHQTGLYDVTLVLPSNEQVGDYTLLGELQIENRTADRCIMRTPLHVGSLEAEMTLFARSEGDAIHVTQRVTNLSDRPLQLRASLLAPELERQNRLIPSLGAGQTTIRDYTLTKSNRFRGQTVRASIEEINGPVRLHQTMRLD